MAKIRIVLAEDHIVVREGIRKFLEHEEDLIVVGEAADGEEAVQMASQLACDVVVMDIAMPKLNGIEATKRIKALHPSMAVLILTAYDYDQYIFALLEAGAAGYLLKDVSGQELIGAIRAVYKGESVLHPAITRKVLDRLRQREDRPGEEWVAGLLSERESEVLKKAAQGMSNKEIADELFLSVRTVEHHLKSVFDKLGVGSRTEAVIYALKKGWFTLEDIS